MPVIAIPERIELSGVPAHVHAWIVAKIPGFVPAILRRWQRGRAEVPQRFSLVLCPQTEINARGGLPLRVVELTDPRLTCRHFTGCQRPFFAVVFVGAEAAARRSEVAALLPWSEGYEVELTADTIRLVLTDANEPFGEADAPAPARRTVQELLARGELLAILD